MVSVSVRQNRPEPIGRNTQPDDPRHNRAYPHPENPGLIEQTDGFYDWAGRRLFLADGSPDPMTPGAYRYQTRPDLCDLTAHASDPASPYYEPPHLRHKPGDTWIIDRDRPHDPDDPGPFGSPDWRPDSRTGRHRRDELPDPIPPWEAAEEAEESDAPEAGGEMPPWRPRRRTSTAAQEPEPEAPATPTGRPRLPVSPDQSAPSPRRRPRFWQEESGEGHMGGEVAQDEEPYRFGKLREDAWDRFIIKSAPLAAAHWADRRALACQHRWLVAALLRAFRWVAAILKGRCESAVSSSAMPSVPRQAQSRPMAIPTRADRAAHTGDRIPQPDQAPEAQPGRLPERPGAAIAAAIDGARAARSVIADRSTRTSVDLAAAVRDSAVRNHATHWRARPRQDRPRPTPRPSIRSAADSYMTAWEQAFDSSHTLIIGGAA